MKLSLIQNTTKTGEKLKLKFTNTGKTYTTNKISPDNNCNN